MSRSVLVFVAVSCLLSVARADPATSAPDANTTDARLNVEPPAPSPNVEPPASSPNLEPAAPDAVPSREPTPPAAPEPPTPPLSPLRIGGELVGAGLLGVVGIAIGSPIGEKIECSYGCSGEDGGLEGAFIGATVGLALAVPAGVYAFGSIGDETGSPIATYVGGLAVGGLAVLVAQTPKNPGARVILTPLAALIGVPIGAIFGFTVSRRYDTGSPSVAIVPQLSRDHATLTFAGSF